MIAVTLGRDASHDGCCAHATSNYYFNKLPKKWKLLNNNGFKNQVKKLLSQKAYYTVTEFLEDKIV